MSPNDGFEKFLKNAYGACSTFSVSRETEPCPISEVQPGDVLIYPTRKIEGMGHALIVIDVARKGKKVAIMCAKDRWRRPIAYMNSPTVLHAADYKVEDGITYLPL